MGKAEKFIQQNTKDCTNKSLKKSEYYLWLTPSEARKAVEIAREEIYEWLSYHLDTSKMNVDYKFEVIEELRKAMKNE